MRLYADDFISYFEWTFHFSTFSKCGGKSPKNLSPLEFLYSTSGSKGTTQNQEPVAFLPDGAVFPSETINPFFDFQALTFVLSFTTSPTLKSGIAAGCIAYKTTRFGQASFRKPSQAVELPLLKLPQDQSALP